MSFFTYSQNNSGGVFCDPAAYVIIEADNADQANDIAEDNGLYFDGCMTGMDCSCCGDRWYRCDYSDATDEPEIYGENPNEKTDFYSQDRCPKFVIIRQEVSA